ncbi:MAG TPA: Rrf2 family transcriptional regulator [Candidatus Dormibacteraeota bacterium]|nr:Rrf2 family transcriptional regulator [Candidatus Dormibacteraeota bacterium]
MRITAKADYALRAMAQLAAEPSDRAVNAERIAEAQDIPLRFLLGIMSELKHARLVSSSRGAGGGYALSRPADEITLAEVLRVVEGPLVNLHDTRVGDLGHKGAARSLTDVWRAVRTNVRFVLEGVTLADVVAGKLPPEIESLASSYRAEPDRAPQTARDN